MEAVILAGGQGRRLLPHTAEIPKPLVPVGDRPIVEILLGQLKKAGVTRVHMAVNHLADMIESALGDGSRLGLEIRYSHEPAPLSTVAPLKLIPDLPDNFLVINGDILTDLDVGRLYDLHTSKGVALTVATHARSETIDYGVITTGPDNVVRGFAEKPHYDFVVSMGVYVFARRLLTVVPEAVPYGFDDLMAELLKNGEPVLTCPYDGYWLDVGRPADYEQAQRDITTLDFL
ncbi:MAG: NTP transferase domain-containing protein [candidate division Zixibacteria bacterium]|nr:NTP transferase domain-containing protein [candidate division Zixibacteria bacterium]